MKPKIELLLILALAFSNLKAQFTLEPTINYQLGKFELAPLPIIQDASDKRATWGLYFWEFGDSHYQISQTPKLNYSYLQQADYNVRVSLTPFYTGILKPLSFSKKISAFASPAKPVVYNIMNYHSTKQVVLVSNTRNEVIPGHKVRMVAHYRIPKNLSNNQNGYLVIFYNHKTELNLNFKPFSFLREELDLFPKNEVIDLASSISILPTALQAKVKTLIDSHHSFRVIKINNMRPNEERRLFFSIIASEELLDSGLLNDVESEDRKLSISTAWIPTGGDFDNNTNTYKYEFKLLKVHDPNKIKVRPKTAYFRKSRPNTFSYTVDFQNIDKGYVRDATIAVAIDKSLDKSSIQVLSRYGARKGIQWKTNCSEFDIKEKHFKCFKMDNSSDPDSVFFTFYNIDLPGKENENINMFNRKLSKGQVVFSIKSSPLKKAKTKLAASISFTGAPPEHTKKAKIKWKEKGLFLKIGGNLANNFGPYESAEESITDRIAVGFSYENAPVGTGIAWGIGGNFSRFRMDRTTITEVTNNIVPNGGILLQSEMVDLDFAEIQGKIGYQFNGFFRAYASGGVSFPVIGNVDLESSVRYTLTAPPIIEDITQIGLGFFNTELDPTIFNQTIESKDFMGFSSGIGIEIGQLNNYSLGLKSEWRFYPNFFYAEHTCFRMSNLSAYFRFKLFTL